MKRGPTDWPNPITIPIHFQVPAILKKLNCS